MSDTDESRFLEPMDSDSFEKTRQCVENRERCFLFVAAAIKFRHEAMANVRFKLTVNDSMSADIASITEAHLESMASELQSGSTTNSALNVNPKIRTLLRTMQGVSGDATWTDHGKHRVRMEAMSLFLTHGAPFICSL